ncbi:MAG: MBL fold metallo-hydrolase [Planctomycetota bacterium]
MKIDTLVLGSYQTNCYILRADETSTDCLIIDIGLESGGLIDFLKQENLKPLAVVFTHGHADHIAGLNHLQKKFSGIKVCIHTLDAEALADPLRNLGSFAGLNLTTRPADVLLQDDQYIEYARIRLKVLHTPGHTPGGICLHSSAEQVLFTGDTLFAGSIGRTDFPYADSGILLESIKQKILPLPETTTLYSGHGPKTSLANEKKYNPFLQKLLGKK